MSNGEDVDELVDVLVSDLVVTHLLAVFGIPVPLATDADRMCNASGSASANLGDHVYGGGPGLFLLEIPVPSKVPFECTGVKLTAP